MLDWETNPVLWRKSAPIPPSAPFQSGLKTVYEPGVHMISMGCGLANVLVAFLFLQVRVFPITVLHRNYRIADTSFPNFASVYRDFLQETKNCSLDSAGKKAEGDVKT